MAGALLATAPGAHDLGEYAGYDFCFRLAVAELAAMPAVGMDTYLAELQAHAVAFPRRLAGEHDWLIVSAPWNLLVAEKLRECEPDALFVLCTRSVQGVCQSLERSFADGRAWAGADTNARIALWCDFYANAQWLSPAHTAMLDYDQLCANPEMTIMSVRRRLSSLGFPARHLDIDMLEESFATGSVARETVLGRDEAGRLMWRTRPAWDPAAWSGDDAASLAASERYSRVRDQLETFALAASESPDLASRDR